MMRTRLPAMIVLALVHAVTSAANRAAASTPMTADGLVLVVNKQQPAGRALAERYAELRHVPADRIIEIDVPDEFEIAPELFDASIADVVRAGIESRQLREKTQCVVTFYGVPLRVRDKPVTPFDQNEVKQILDPSVTALRAQLKRSVEGVEAVATRLDPAFKPDLSATNTEQLRLRGVEAEQALAPALAKLDAGARADVEQKLVAAKALLMQMPKLPASPLAKSTTPLTQARVNELLAKPDDPDARRELREGVFASGNIYQLLTVVEAQQRALQGGEGEASVDSELSCLWINNYPRQKWVANPWHWGSAPAMVAQLRPLTVRVARLDGPTPEIAKRVFEEAVAIEDRGLAGDVVLDARGLTGTGQVGSYDTADQAIRNVAKLLPGNDDLKPIFDNAPALLPDHSSERAAIYCGWYSVRKYKPTVKLVPGSIAWHVASFELVALRPETEGGWCHG